jgi:fructokinase
MRIGIDLGGTKIEAIALDDSGGELFRQRVPTPATDYAAILEAIAGLVDAAERATGRKSASVGVGTPGAVSPSTGTVKNSNTKCLTGRPFDRDLGARLGRPVRIANDANCFALSEATDGAAAGAGVVFGVIIGTGTGGGIVIDGKVLCGVNAIAGEWGHNPLPWPQASELPGPTCYCGRKGCIETFLSGPGLAHDFEAATGRKEKGNRIAELAAGGDAEAEAAFARYEDRMARSLAAVMNLLDPEVIVLGGGVSNVSRLYQNVPRLWSKYVFSDAVATRLVKAKFGDSSGVRGAAWLWS